MNALDDNYILFEKEYIPEYRPIKYFEIKFKKESNAILSDVLTHYGARKEYYSSFIKKCLRFKERKKDKESLKYHFSIHNDINDNESDTKFGEFAIIANPEYYPHVYYRFSDEKIILYHPFLESRQSAYYDFDTFFKTIIWWQNYLDSNFST